MAKASDFLIAVDDGHGPQTAGKRTPYIASLGRQIRENEFNKAVVDLFEKELKQCGFRTLQLAPTDLDTPLTTRTNTANRAKADLLISVHFNAMGNTFAYSSAKGFSAHIQEGLSNSSKAYKAAQLIIEELKKGTPQVNRGIVKQNLAITRQSAMPAVLVECGFMDDPGEALLMISKSFHREVAKELATAVCRFFGVPYKGTSVTPASKPSTVEKDYLIYDDRGHDVEMLQKYLTQVGYPVKVNGHYSAETKKAVMEFQKDRGLTVDGIYGKGSKAEMNKALKELTKSAVKPAAPIKNEEDETLELTKRQREEIAATFKTARERGVFSSADHEKAIVEGKMTQSELLYLNNLIAGAALIGGERIE